MELAAREPGQFRQTMLQSHNIVRDVAQELLWAFFLCHSLAEGMGGWKEFVTL